MKMKEGGDSGDIFVMSRAAKTTIVGVLITGVLAGAFAIGKSGIRAIVQEAAKEAVDDTISKNVASIEKLDRLVSENEREDAEVHGKVAELERTLERVEKELTMLRAYVDEQSKKIDRLTEILLRYFNEKNESEQK